jgi:hypothetical protein
MVEIDDLLDAALSLVDRLPFLAFAIRQPMQA